MSPTKQSIIKYLIQNPQTSVVKLLVQFTISKQAMHKHLKELIELGEIEKQGLPPKVYYSIRKNINSSNLPQLNDDNLSNFITINAIGIKKTGVHAFVEWCNERNYDVNSYYNMYLETISKYDKYYNEIGVIDATHKIQNTFENECYVDTCMYYSFSAIEIFGKTGIYAQMLYAKQSGNKQNMIEIFPEFAQKVHHIIKKYKIEAIGFVPPTVPRKIQLIKELQKYLKLLLPRIEIQKISNEYLVPQKTLSKPSDRKLNAENTFVVESVPTVNNILLLDDFVGSGSSFNYIAKKIKLRNRTCKVICFAISGTPNGIINNENKKFEVINEA